MKKSKILCNALCGVDDFRLQINTNIRFRPNNRTPTTNSSSAPSAATRKFTWWQKLVEVLLYRPMQNIKVLPFRNICKILQSWDNHPCVSYKGAYGGLSRPICCRILSLSIYLHLVILDHGGLEVIIIHYCSLCNPSYIVQRKLDMG